MIFNPILAMVMLVFIILWLLVKEDRWAAVWAVAFMGAVAVVATLVRDGGAP